MSATTIRCTEGVRKMSVRPQILSPAPEAIPMIDLRAEHAAIEGELLEAFRSVLDTGRFILGDFVEGFESDLAKFCASRHAIGCNSGTDALWLALRGLGIGPGDAVLCPAYSFFASAATIVRVGATPIFVDIDPCTLNLDPEDAIRRAENHPEIRAVLSVDLFGRLCELGPLQSVARERGWAIIEDAAQSIDALDSNGSRPGRDSDVACLSFYPTKNLGALGDAGAVVTDAPELAQRMASLRMHGESTPGRYEEIGINSRLDALQAVALTIKLRQLEARTHARRQLALHYDALFAERGAHPATAPLGSGRLPLQTPPPTPAPGRHSYHRYVVRVPAESRAHVIDALRAEGIGSEVYYRYGLHQQPALAAFSASIGPSIGRSIRPSIGPGNPVRPFVETERATHEALALPLFPELSVDGIERVVGCVTRSLRK
jgi:dTDP-4-amino-4,6-dideoxygalactose transaminase